MTELNGSEKLVPPVVPTPPREALVKALAEDAQHRVQAVSEGLTKLLGEHNCRIEGKAYIDDAGRVRSQVIVVANE